MLSSLCHSAELKHRVLGQNSEMQWSGKTTTVQNEVRHPLLQVSLKLIALFTTVRARRKDDSRVCHTDEYPR